MALSRLLQVKSKPHFQRLGLVNPTVWWCYCTYSSSSGEAQRFSKFDLGKAQDSSSSSSHSKKLIKAAAVESFVVKYMETHQGTFPKVAYVQNNLGGSWYTVKGILTHLKEKMVGNPQLENHSASDASDSKVDVTASEVSTTHISDDISEMGEVKSTLMNSDTSPSNEKNYTNSTSHVVEESSSKDLDILEASNVVKMTSASPIPKMNSEVGGKRLVTVSGPQKIIGTADLLTRIGETTGERNDRTPNSPDFVNESTGRGGEKGCEILSLLDCIKDMPEEKSNLRSQNSITSNNMDQASNKGAVKGMQHEAHSLRSDAKGRNCPMNCRTMVNETNNFKGSEGNTYTDSLFELFDTKPSRKDTEGNPMRKGSEGSGADIAAFNSIKLKQSQEILPPASKQDFKKAWNALLAEKKAHENQVLVRFLHVSTTRNDIDTLFNDCGCITRIEFHYNGGLHKIACIDFKTKEGMQIALKKPGLIHRDINLIVEAACSKDNIPSRTLIPNLIGYPEVPASIVKNPTRTVMIKQLTPDINSRDVEEALAFCGSKISGFFFGSSSSVAYLEFATEEAKQRALERNSIRVSGKLLRIFRIDAPRTTVVRISNLYYPGVRNTFEGICGSYGRIKHLVVRSKDIVDVHFNLTEWPNMLRILNGLNGLQVSNRQWIAQQAPVFPPEVLHVLWKHPDERRHLKTQIHSLLQKLVEYPAARNVGLASITNEYYGAAWE